MNEWLPNNLCLAIKNDHFAFPQSDGCVCIKYGLQYVWLLCKIKFSISFDDRKGGKKEVCKVIK